MPSRPNVIHLRKERLRAYATWCGRWSHGTMSPHLAKVTCDQCLRAYRFIGPIHPDAGGWRRRVGRDDPWNSKPHWVELREWEEAEARKWERDNKHKRRRIIDVSITAACATIAATGCNHTTGMV